MEPEPVMVEGSLTSNSSRAGASARLFFCCEMYGAYDISDTAQMLKLVSSPTYSIFIDL